MTVYAPGCPSDTYLDRISEQLRCVCYERGDRNVFLDGKGPYCIIIDREFEKIELDDVGVNSTTIEALWLTCDQIPIKKGTELISGGYKYKARNSPADQHDGWTSVQLTLRCKC